MMIPNQFDEEPRQQIMIGKNIFVVPKAQAVVDMDKLYEYFFANKPRNDRLNEVYVITYDTSDNRKILLKYNSKTVLTPPSYTYFYNPNYDVMFYFLWTKPEEDPILDS